MQQARRADGGPGGGARVAGVPTRWLFTDERLGGLAAGDALWRAVARLPRGGGIVFRHYGWAESERRALLGQLSRVARRRGLMIVGSCTPGARDGVHRPGFGGTRPGRSRGAGLVTAGAHDRAGMLAAFRGGADLVFLSPVFPTSSHPGGRALGPVRFGLAVRGAPGPVMALGGMTEPRFRQLQALGAAGYGAIDGWVEKVGNCSSRGFPVRAADR